MKTRSAILAAALSAAVLATPALADTPNARIRTSDLNLATAQGQEQLDRRIDAAARAMCGISDIRTGTILQGNKQKQCFESARVTARQQVAAQIAHTDAAGG
jgi:UrcA family protein